MPPCLLFFCSLFYSVTIEIIIILTIDLSDYFLTYFSQLDVCSIKYQEKALDDILFCLQPKGFQFSVMEGERKQIPFSFEKLKSKNFDLKKKGEKETHND